MRQLWQSDWFGPLVVTVAAVAVVLSEGAAPAASLTRAWEFVAATPIEVGGRREVLVDGDRHT